MFTEQTFLGGGRAQNGSILVALKMKILRDSKVIYFKVLGILFYKSD